MRIRGSAPRPSPTSSRRSQIEGAAPTERMEVQFAYDGSALYVGARMYSRAPSAIQAPMSRRDDVDTQMEHIFVSLDTFLDRRTAYTFGVTASGVRFDHFHRQDDEETADATFRSGLGSQDLGRREGVDRRTLDPILAAAVQRSGGTSLGAERAAFHADARGTRRLGARAADGPSMGVTLRAIFAASRDSVPRDASSCFHSSSACRPATPRVVRTIRLTMASTWRTASAST